MTRKKTFLASFSILSLGLAGILIAPTPAEAHDRHNGSDRVYIVHAQPACRDYTRTLYFQFGETRVSYGTACQRDNGNWYVVRESDSSHWRSTPGPVRVAFRDGPGSGFVYFDGDNDDGDDWKRKRHRGHGGDYGHHGYYNNDNDQNHKHDHRH